MNVISASRRTDIPAWYGSWLMKRIEAGRAAYRSPFSSKIHEVSLRPEEVTAFVFWTKNAGPFLRHLEKILSLGYKAFFQYTLTGYGSLLEAGVPPWPRALGSFKKLSQLLGPRYVRWRYDPILMGRGYDRDFHRKNFSTLAARLEGFTEVCHVSFVQFYRKTRSNLDALELGTGFRAEDPEEEEKIRLALELRAMAEARGIRMMSCCYPLLIRAGIEEGSCVDPELIRLLRPDRTGSPPKAKPTREGCRCAASRDIGAYETCPGACVYCYATRNPDQARHSFKHHDPDSERLI